MIVSLRHLIGWMVSAFRSREDLVLENLALRQQLLALHAQRPRRRLTALHKLFWVALRMCWSGWRQPLVLVTPRTVVNWHRAGFRLYWTWVSRISQVGGRKSVSKEVRALIFRMVAENPTWGAPRIHGELLKLGFDLSERSVSRWIRRAPRNPDPVKRWLTFLRNHREAIAAICSLGCTAIARSMGLQTATQILAIRSRRKVWSRRGFGSEGDRKPANSHGLSQSVAERCC
jgi:putative transposase